MLSGIDFSLETAVKDPANPDRPRLSTRHITRSMIRKLREIISADPPAWLRQQIADAKTQPMKVLDLAPRADPPAPPELPPKKA